MNTRTFVTQPAKGKFVGNVNVDNYPSATARMVSSDLLDSEAEALEWCKTTVANWWTNPAPRKLDPRDVLYAGRAYFVPFDYGTGHGVSRWSASTWAVVHQLQKSYIRETAQAWKDAGELSKDHLARLEELKRQSFADKVPHPTNAGKMTSAGGWVRDYRERARKELDELEARLVPLGDLRKVLREAGERRDRMIAQATR